MSDIKTDYYPAEPTEKEEKRFTPINKIDRSDGWLAPPGLFWGCNPNEHDIVAQYILRTETPYIYEHVLEGDSEKYTTFRRALFEEGYAHLSHGKLFLPERSLSDKQIKLLNKANIKIPVLLGEGSVRDNLRELFDRLDQGDLDNYERDILRKLFTRWHAGIDDNTGLAHRVYRVISKDLEDGGYAGDSRDSNYYAYPKDKSFIVSLSDHQHDGGTPGVSIESNISFYAYEGYMADYIERNIEDMNRDPYADYEDYNNENTE